MKLGKRLLSVLLIIVLVFPLCINAAAESKPSVQRSAQNLTVDGNPVTCEKYNIDGSNYFKLRDIACVLNGTGSSFCVDYDSQSKTITLTTGAEYAADGSELKVGADRSRTAVRSSQSVRINGEPVSFQAYNIGGNNYFKLRDLGDALGFQVSYQAETQTAAVVSAAADPKQEALMRSQWGNFSKFGAAVQTADAVYYAAKSENQDSVKYVLIERQDTGALRTIAESDKRFDKLFLREDGNLYVLNSSVNDSAILKINPETGARETYFTTDPGRCIECFMFYDDTLFFVDQSLEASSDSWTYRLRSRSESGAVKTLDTMNFDESLYLDDSLYAYNGTLYYVGGNGTERESASYVRTRRALYAIDLATGTKTAVFCDDDVTADGYRMWCSDVTYIGGKAYLLGGKTADGGKETYAIVQVDLSAPEQIRTYAVLTAEMNLRYQSLYANGSQLYFQSSGGKKLWSVSQTGEFTVLTTSPTANYEDSMMTRQCLINAPIGSINQVYNHQVVVILPDGTVTNYRDFLQLG